MAKVWNGGVPLGGRRSNRLLHVTRDRVTTPTDIRAGFSRVTTCIASVVVADMHLVGTKVQKRDI